jgi:hypothetical protein
MNKTSMMSTAAAVTMLLGQGLAHAASVSAIAPGASTAGHVVNFGDLGELSGFPLGKSFDSVLVSGGVSFGERFVGQTNTPIAGSDWDVLSGTPSGPLALAFGPADRNLSVYSGGSLNASLAGLGPKGMTAEGLGEGALAALFPFDQSEIGFDLLITHGGVATIDFFRRDGSLISQLKVGLEGSFGVGNQVTGNQTLAFKLIGGTVADRIAGFSVYNDDPGGIVIDDIRFDSVAGTNAPAPAPSPPPSTPPAITNQVSEPASLPLLGLAMLVVAWTRRRG